MPRDHESAPLLQVTTLHTSRDVVYNSEESERISKSIEDILGLFSKLSGKLPRPILGLILVAGLAIPIVIDAVLTKGTGSVFSLIFSTENIGKIINTVWAGLGFFTLYNASNLSRKIKQGREGIDPTLKVVDTNTMELRLAKDLIEGRLALAVQENTKLQSKVDEQAIFVKGLIAIIRQSNPELLASDQIQKLFDSAPSDERTLSAVRAPFTLLASSPVVGGPAAGGSAAGSAVVEGAPIASPSHVMV